MNTPPATIVIECETTGPFAVGNVYGPWLQIVGNRAKGSRQATNIIDVHMVCTRKYVTHPDKHLFVKVFARDELLSVQSIRTTIHETFRPGDGIHIAAWDMILSENDGRC